MVVKTLNLTLFYKLKRNLIQIYALGNDDVVDELLRNEADMSVSVSDDSEKTLLDLAKQQSNYL